MDVPLASRKFRHYCLQCNIRFPTEDSLLKHVIRHARESRCSVNIDRYSVPKKYDFRDPPHIAVDEAIDAEEQFERFIPVMKLKRVKKKRSKARFEPNWVTRKKRRTGGPGKGIVDEEVDAVAIAVKNVEPVSPLMDSGIDVNALKDLSCAVAVEQQLPETPVTSEQIADGEIGVLSSSDSSRTLAVTPEPDIHDESAVLSTMGSNLDSPSKASDVPAEPSIPPHKVLDTIELQFPNTSAEVVVASNDTATTPTGSVVCWSEATTGLGENGKTGICPICQEQTLTDYDLLKHLEDHCAEVEMTEPKFTCIHPRCKKDFKMKGLLTRHYNQSGHASPCTYCSSVFKTKSALSEHLHVAHAKKLKQLENNAANDSGMKKGNNPVEQVRVNGNKESAGTLMSPYQTPMANVSRKSVDAVPDLISCGPRVDTKETSINLGQPDSVTPVNSSVPGCVPKDLAPVPVKRMSNGASRETSNATVETTSSDKPPASFGIQKIQSQPFPSLIMNVNDNAGVSVSYTTASPDNRPKLTVPLHSVLTHYTTSSGNLVSPLQLTANVTICPLNVQVQSQPPNAIHPRPPQAHTNQINANNAPLSSGRSLLVKNQPRFLNSQHAPPVNANCMPYNGQPSQRMQGFDPRKEMTAPDPNLSGQVFSRACAMQPPIQNTQPKQNAMKYPAVQRIGPEVPARMPGGSNNQARLALQQALRTAMNPQQQLQARMVLPSRIIHQQQPNPVVCQPPAAIPASVANVPASPTVASSFQKNVGNHQGAHATKELSRYFPTTQASQRYLQHAQPQVLMSTGLRHQTPMQTTQLQSAMQLQAPPMHQGSTFPLASNPTIPAQSGEGEWGIQYVTRYNSSNPISTTVTSSVQNIGYVSRPTSGVQYCPTTLKETGDQLLAAMTLNRRNSSLSCNTVGTGCVQPSRNANLSVHLLNSYCNSKRVLRCGTCNMPASSHQSLHFHRQFCRMLLRTCVNCRQVFENVLQLQDHRKGNCTKPPTTVVSNASQPSTLPSMNNDVHRQQQRLNGSRHEQGNNAIAKNPMLLKQLAAFPMSTLGIQSISPPCSTMVSSTVLNVITQSAPTVSTNLPTIVVLTNDVVRPATCQRDATLHPIGKEAPVKSQPCHIEPRVIVVEDDNGVNIIETPLPEVTTPNSVSEGRNLEKEQPGEPSDDVQDDQGTMPFLVISDVTTVTKSRYDACDAEQDVREVPPKHENLPNGFESSKRASLPSPGCEESPAMETNDLGKAEKPASDVVVDCPNIPAEDENSNTIADCPSIPHVSNSSNTVEGSSIVVSNQAMRSPVHDTQNKQVNLHTIAKVCDTDCASSSPGNKKHSTSLEDKGSGCKVVEERLAEDSVPDHTVCINANIPTTEHSPISIDDLPDIDMDYMSKTTDESDHVVSLSDEDEDGERNSPCPLASEKKNGVTICKVCDLEFPSMELLDEHWPVHRHARKRKCIKCTRMFPNKVSLLTHFRSHLRSCRKVPQSGRTVMNRIVVSLGDNKSHNGSWLVPVVDAATFCRHDGKLDKLLRMLGAKFVTIQDLKNTVRNGVIDTVVPAVYPVNGDCVE